MLWNEDIPMTERLYFLMCEFAGRTTRTVPMSRVLMAEILLGEANEKTHAKIGEALRNLEKNGRVRCMDRPPKFSGRTFNQTAFTYRIADPVVDVAREDVALAALNRFSKYNNYIRPSEYKDKEREAVPKKEGKTFIVPDILIPKELTLNPAFNSLFEQTKEARTSWNTIAKVASEVNPAALQVFISTCGLYFGRTVDVWGSRKIENPGSILYSLVARIRDAAQEGVEWETKFTSDKFKALIKKASLTPPNALKLRDLVIG